MPLNPPVGQSGSPNPVAESSPTTNSEKKDKGAHAAAVEAK